MKSKQNLLHWANLLYVVLVVLSFPIVMAGSGKGAPPFGLDPALAGIAAQVGLLLVPALLFVLLTRQKPAEALKLQRVSIGSGLKCLLIGLTAFPMFLALGTLTQALLAILHPVSTSTSSVVLRTASPWLAFLGVAIVAPLCEEVLFRGALFSAYEQRLAKHAIWLVAVLFALYHVSSELLLGALLLGAIAGWVVYRTRSVWSGVLVHLGTNVVAGLLALATQAAAGTVEESPAGQGGDLGSMLWLGMAVWGGVGLVMLVPCGLLLRSLARRHAAPAAPEVRPSLSGLWSWAAAVVVVVGVVVYYLLR